MEVIEDKQTADTITNLFAWLLMTEQARNAEDLTLTLKEYNRHSKKLQIGDQSLRIEYNDENKQLIICNDMSLPLHGMMDALHSAYTDLHDRIKKRGATRSKFYHNTLEAGRAAEIFNFLIDHYVKDNPSFLHAQVVEEKGKIRLDMPHAAHHLLTQKEACEIPGVFHSIGSQFMEMLSFMEKQPKRLDFMIKNTKDGHCAIGFAFFNALIAVTHRNSAEYPDIPDTQKPVVYDDGLFHVQYVHDPESNITNLQSNRPLPYDAMKEWYLHRVKEFERLKPNGNGEYVIQSKDIGHMSQWMMLVAFWAENEDGVDIRKLTTRKKTAEGLPCITMTKDEYEALCRQMQPTKRLQASKALNV